MPDIESASKSTPSSVRTFGMSWPLLVACLALLVVLGIVRLNVLADPDTYWHLATGRWILEHGAVPKVDPFSHSMPGTAWIAHEWLSEFVLAGVYQVAGWAGLGVVVTVFGLCVSVLSFAGGLWTLWERVVNHVGIPGWASTLVPMFFLGGIQLLSLGVIGEYVAKTYMESKGRPRYIIDREV